MIVDNMRTWAEIRLKAIISNYNAIRDKLPDNCRFMGIVKADAYGHGAAVIAKVLQDLNCEYLAVACLEEAEELRKAEIKLPILILGTTPPEFSHKLIDLDVTQTVTDFETAKAYSDALTGTGRNLKVHLKLETGMGRLGFNVKNGDVDEISSVLTLPNLKAEGVFTHFAASDEPNKEEYTKNQYRLFMSAIHKIEENSGYNFKIRHCANSGAVINYQCIYLDMVRPGLSLYGLYPGNNKGEINLQPAMELKSRISAVTEHEAGDCISYGCTFVANRKMRVAVLPIGYADGLHRVLSGKIDVLIHGRRCRQIGRICMDMCMIDVTDIPNVKAGDVATVFGIDGEEFISIDELAEKAGTISYELLCSVSQRVPRIYID